MKDLTLAQKEFLLQTFFKDERFAGWKNIAEALLTKGHCYVPGTDCIWKGGIGNFIKIEEAPELVGCVKYSFDLPVFLSSAWFKEVKEQYAGELYQDMVNAKNKYNEISELCK